MFKGKSKYISGYSHMGMEQNHNINVVGNKYLKILQKLKLLQKTTIDQNYINKVFNKMRLNLQ
jgi:hypothetical protein